MKRFFSLLTVFVLSFVMAVPAFAYDFNGTELPLPDGLAESELEFDSTNPVYIYLFKRNLVYDFMISSLPLSVEGDDIVNNYDEDIFIEWLYLNTNNPDNVWTINDSFTIPAGGRKSYHNSQNLTYVWSNIDSYFCNGSSCSATDVNFDDICDDCGILLAYNLRVTPNTYEVVVEHSDSLTVKYSYTETLAGTSFDAVYNDNRIIVSFDNPVNHYQYKLVDGEWTDYASYPNQYGTHTISLSGDASILASDMDIYDSNGDLFFQNPLWMTVEKVTQGEMENLTSEMGGTMKTLVVCGVGLMACLMALSLFGKRWLLFLR